MRTRFDQFSKQITRAALEHDGQIETEPEVSVETRRIDLWFTPARHHRPVSPHLGLLGRMTQEPSTLEFFHRTPSNNELVACVLKHGDFRHSLARRKLPPPMPTQWIVSSGRPDSGIEGLWLRPMAAWPRGVYEAAPLLTTRLVVVNELPTTRDTLLVRLYGADDVLSRALVDLKALPANAPERAFAQPSLLRLRLEVPADPVKRTPEDEEYLMHTQDIVEAWERQAIQKGRLEGRVEGRVEGRIEGRVEGFAEAMIGFYESRFGAMPKDLRAVIEGVHDSAILDSWLKLLGTASAEEIDEAIRRVRPS